MANIILTGAAGFIGSKVAELLLARGDSVWGVDNLSEAYDVRMKVYRLDKLLTHSNFHCLRADIADRATINALADFAPKSEVLINLAAVAGVRASAKDPWSYLATNTLGCLNMLEYCKTQGINKFVSASSSSVYGDQGKPPHKETADTDHPLAPYAASKKSSELFTYSYHHLYGIDASLLRFFTVFGPAGRPDMSMFRFTQWINEGKPVIVTGNGNQSRGFTYLDDIAEGVLLAMKPCGYEIFNLGGHEVITINELICKIETRLGKKAKIQYIPSHPADVFENLADVQKAREMLGWQPKVSLDEGLDRLVAWYLENREFAKNIETP